MHLVNITASGSLLGVTKGGDMKKLISLLLFISAPAFAAGQQLQGITNWDASLPRIEAQVINMIETKAYEDFYHENEGLACGGDTMNFALSDYYTFESVTGDITSHVKVKFYVTGSYDYCRGIVLSECEAPLNIYSDTHVSMGRWTCTVVQAP